MKNTSRILSVALIGLFMTSLSMANETRSTSPNRAATNGDDAKSTSLLLPAVQKVAPATTAPAPARAPSTDVQRMLRELKPRPAPVTAQPAGTGQKAVAARPPEPPKYEVADCTGSDGVPKACCAWSPGDGGSSCEMFIALCNSHDGWSGQGSAGGATCSGEGTVE